MTALTLTRSEHDRKTYVLDGFGHIRLGGMFSRTAVITAAGGRTWEGSRKGLMQRIAITDEAGAEAARFDAKGMLRRGGTLSVGDAEYALEPSAKFKERYALSSGGQELATVSAGGWSGTRIDVEIHEQAHVDPLVLLTACWLVRGFAEDSGSAAAASAGA